MGSLAFGDVVVSTSAIGNRGTNDIYTVDVSVLLANIQSDIGSTIQGFNTAPPTLHLNLNNQFSDFYLNKWVQDWPPPQTMGYSHGSRTWLRIPPGWRPLGGGFSLESKRDKARLKSFCEMTSRWPL